MKLNKWKTVAIDTSDIPFSELEHLGGIEELLDYEILKPESETGKAKKRKAKRSNKERKGIPTKQFKTEQEIHYDEVFNTKDYIERERIESTTLDKIAESDRVQESEPESLNEDEQESKEIDMSAWSSCYFHDSILRGLKDLGFQKPTKIQELTIPTAVRGNYDILGAAETGSGKTLAFGIPIINSIISIKESKKQCLEDDFTDVKRPLYCLILTPTRELAIQIKKHLQAICKYTDILISVIVGGMASEKQKRVLRKGPEIVIATPGRLWELIDEGESHVNQAPNIRYLVIDEADRMVEKGHFAELTQILNLINGSDAKRKRQTFVFSATLTLVHDVPNRLALKSKKGKIQQKQKLDSLINLIGMKDPKVIDITKKTALVESLMETQILCSNEEKDAYLYYFLLMHPGRTLVFCNSIDCVRRLRTVLEYLNCHPLPLHASMHQKQRLKNLERFEESSTGVLLATDVAARGLDIKGIEHVIHFQVPRTAETYVHRSGRTARAETEGLSLVLIEPQDAVFYKRICKTLEKDKTLPNFPVDYKVFKLVKERVTLSRSIDKMEHKMKRLDAQNRWFQNTAKEMDVDIDDENLLIDVGDKHEQAAKRRQINSMKKQLKAMLAKPITSKIFTGCYPTKSGKLINPEIYKPQKAVNIAKKIHEKRKL